MAEILDSNIDRIYLELTFWQSVFERNSSTDELVVVRLAKSSRIESVTKAESGVLIVSPSEITCILAKK
jgi:hypothetical protein